MFLREVESQQHTTAFVKAHWGLTNNLEIQDFTRSGYYGGVSKITYGDVSYAHKCYPKASSSLLRFTSKVFNHLKDRGFTNFPEFIPTTEGADFVCGTDGKYHTLTPWIDGTTLRNEDCGSLAKEKIKSVASAVAQFHKKANDFPKNEDVIRDERISEMWAPELVERHATVAGIADMSVNLFKTWGVGDQIGELLTASEPLIHVLTNGEKLASLEQSLTEGIAHCDLWIGHWLFDPREKVYLIDFDRLRYGRLTDDVERIVSESMQADKRYGSVALTAYLSQNMLPEEEIHKLPFLIQYGVVRRTFWLIDQFLKKGDVLNDGPLNLSTEIKRAIEIMNTDVGDILFHN